MPYQWVSSVLVAHGTASNEPSPATITIDSTVRGQLNTGGEYLWLEIDGEDPVIEEVPSSAGNAWFYTALSSIPNLIVTNLGGTATKIESVGVGTAATLHLRGGNYGAATRALYEKTSGEGYSDDGVYLETRVYVFTWVENVAGFSFESAPSPASVTVDVNDGQSARLSGMPAAPQAGFTATHKRIYRSVSGTFLYVDEIPGTQTSYVDSKKAEELGEELPSATWSRPPMGLKGLLALNNGMMAAFVGKDVYLCEPFRPHAWPTDYVVTVEHNVVGLGTMDSTLAVLTEGSPVFIQGIHPSTMTVVKTDIEQACVSKRSIVSYGASVFYASPDGLIVLSPGGSRNVTEMIFDRAQWQAIGPNSIHAYQHDQQYVAFYDNGNTQGGFIYDMKTGTLVMHDDYATAGYNDLATDTLYVTYADRTVKKWARGSSVKTYAWVSKEFTNPQPTGYSVGQVEAEAYPVTLKIYGDGTLIQTKSVTSRDPFRIPAGKYRDWQLRVEGTAEVFSVAIATSPSELAGD